MKKTESSTTGALPFLECLIYYVTWCGAALYSCYGVFNVSHDLKDKFITYHFTEGWWFLYNRKDISNFEWEFWSGWFGRIWHLYLGHIVIGQALRWFGFQHRKWVFSLYGMYVMYVMMGPAVLLYIVCLCVVCYLAAMTGFLLLVWVVSLLALTMLNFQPYITWLAALVGEDPDENRLFLLMFTAAMFNIRYTSFCSEWCQDKNSVLSYSLLDMLSYCFYLPTLCTGPIVTYDQFYTQFHAPLKPWTRQELCSILTSILWVLFWACVCELTLHYFYFNALMAQPELMADIPLWALSGVGYAQGQFFMVKYVVMFGLPRNAARLDQLDPPQGPKCIARIYLYSEMWKYFDRGLYSFIKRHIYIPLGGSHLGVFRQLLAALASFAFIFYWHGAEDYLLYWVLFNFLGITIETLGSRMDAHPTIRRHLHGRLSPAWIQRLKGILAIPLLAMSSIAIFTFFGGISVGKIIYQRLLFEGWPVSTLTVAFVLYSMIQTSADVGRREKAYKID